MFGLSVSEGSVLGFWLGYFGLRQVEHRTGRLYRGGYCSSLGGRGNSEEGTGQITNNLRPARAPLFPKTFLKSPKIIPPAEDQLLTCEPLGDFAYSDHS